MGGIVNQLTGGSARISPLRFRSTEFSLALPKRPKSKHRSKRNTANSTRALPGMGSVRCRAHGRAQCRKSQDKIDVVYIRSSVTYQLLLKVFCSHGRASSFGRRIDCSGLALRLMHNHRLQPTAQLALIGARSDLCLSRGPGGATRSCQRRV